MAAKKTRSAKAPANSKKNGAAASGKKAIAKASERQKTPHNAEEATLIAWAATYANRHKRFKVWENR